MAEDDWRLTVHDARTGEYRETLQVVDGGSSWSTGITADGQSTEVVVVNDPDAPWTPSRIVSAFEPNDRLIARWWGDWCLYAQKIESYDYDDDAGTVTVKTVDLLPESEWRLIAGVGGGSDLVVTSRSASGAIRAVLDRMMSTSSYWEFPIDLPSDGAGSISGVWPFWKKLRISDILQQIEDQAGVETFLRAYGSGNNVRFQTLVAPTVTYGASKFHLGAEDSPLGGVHYKVDGKRQVTGILGLGNGSGEDQATAYQGGSGSGTVDIPIRDTRQTFTDLTGAALQAAVDAYYDAHVNPLRQLSVDTFTIGGEWTPEHAAPGRAWAVESQGNPVIPDGTMDLRVIKLSGNNSREMKAEVQDAAA